MHDGNLHRKSAIIKSSRSFQRTLASAPSALALGKTMLCSRMLNDRIDFGC